VGAAGSFVSNNATVPSGRFSECSDRAVAFRDRVKARMRVSERVRCGKRQSFVWVVNQIERLVLCEIKRIFFSG